MCSIMLPEREICKLHSNLYFEGRMDISLSRPKSSAAIRPSISTCH